MFTALVEQIVTGTLRPGEEIRDQDLQLEYGVSRTPVREALLRLADLGLVTIAANRHTRVAAVNLADQADRAEAACAIISFCALASCSTYSAAQAEVILGKLAALADSDLVDTGSRAGLAAWYALWAEIVNAHANVEMIATLNTRFAIHLTRSAQDTPTTEEDIRLMREFLDESQRHVINRDGPALHAAIVKVFDDIVITPLRRAASVMGHRPRTDVDVS